MELAEIIEAIEGCALVVEDMCEGDPRAWAVVAALRKCAESLDDMHESADGETV